MGVEWRSFNSGDEVPHDAIEGGKEADGSPLYVARAEIDGHWHPGKFGAQTGRGALVGYAGKEKYFGKYQLLCGDKDSVKWVDRTGPTTACEGFTPVEGGSDSEGNPLWVCHVQVQDSIVPGKTGPAMNGGTAAYAGQEINDNQWYAILCTSN